MTDFKDFLSQVADRVEREENSELLEGINGTIVDGELKIVSDEEAKAIKYDGTLCRPVSWGQMSVDSIEEPCVGCEVPVWVSQKTIEVTGKDCPRFCPDCMMAKIKADEKEEA